MMSRRHGQRAQRTHLLGGCQNCRIRHAKCDQTRPECLMCTMMGFKCQGYELSVQWVTENDHSAPQEKMGTRAHLYTEEARRFMSNQMTKNFQCRTVDSTLNDIDSCSRGEELSRSGIVLLGPFGVLNIAAHGTQQVHQSKKSSNTDFPDADQTNVTNISPNLLQDAESMITTPSILDSLLSIPDHLDWSDIFNLDIESWFSPQLSNIDLDGAYVRSSIGDSPTIATTTTGQVVTSTPSLLSVTNVLNEELDQQTLSLIRHFDSEVIGSIASLPFNQKSPYKILNVTAAVQTHANLTYLRNPVKHADVANLHGILACSAYHLATNPSGTGISRAQCWHDIAVSAAEKARIQLQRSLRDELDGSNRAKYKTQVMALMNLLAYSVAAGHQKDVRCYLIDIERLLRLRGLPKRQISRRARLLHHMYTWNRIVGESTYVLHEGSSATIAFTKPIPRPQMNNVACLDDFLRIEQSDEHDTEGLEAVKDPDIALRDVHLRNPNPNPNTMYLQIYGLPETWLSLLSQTTRLANAKELFNRDSRHESLLKQRISRLEDMICTFASGYTHERTEGSGNSSQYMIQALNSALVIFFYRRIMAVNSLILQSHVDDVINSLKLFDASLRASNIKGPGTAWPAFIAGCEAAPGPRRDALLKWVDAAYWKTGSQSFLTAKEMMEEVWNRRQAQASSSASDHSGVNKSSNVSVTWISLSKERKTWVILC